MSDRVYEVISIEQLCEIFAEVKRNHDWPLKGRKIKYIDMHYDNRNMSVFTIKFRQSGDHIVSFTSCNRYDAETMEMQDVRLFKEVMDWLDEGLTTEGTQ